MQADGQLFYKIGITTRPIPKRLAEINRDLRPHFGAVEIEVLQTWANRGNVERYFKYRYSKANYPIDSLTEYFRFAEPDETQAVERDLSQMPTKVLSPVERDIIDGKQDKFLATVLADRSFTGDNKRVSDRLQVQLKQNFLTKPLSQQGITALHQGASLCDAAAIASVSVDVARKVLAVNQ